MPLFMDVHEQLPSGARFEDVVGARAADTATQGAHGVRYANYWVDEAHGKAFCLIEAPTAAAATPATSSVL